MLSRFACLLPILSGAVFAGSLLAQEPPEKPDPDRFGSPLMRAWIPSTLAVDHQAFRYRIQQEKTAEDSESQPADSTTEESTAREELPQREGLLVFYDPEGLSRTATDNPQNLWPAASNPYHFLGHLWLKPVRFMKVGSREEFEKEIRRRTGAFQDPKFGILKEQGDGYVFDATLQWLELFETSTSLDRYLIRVSRYWTYRDGYMFFGDFEEILEMEFPSPRDLEPKGTDADRDLFVQVDLNAVLPRQKRILWDIIRKHAERSLQQYDDEGDARYAFRKAVGDLQLNLIQAVTNDLEAIRLGIDFGSEDKPARAELELVARPRVNLEHYFGSSGIGTPALAAFVAQPAAMTLATSWGLPERMGQTLEKFLNVVDANLDQQPGWTLDAILASKELTQDLLDTIRGHHQLALKLTQTEHGFTLYGGVRIRNAARVSDNLAIILNGLTGRDGWGVQRSRDDTGRTYYSFRPEDLTQSVTRHHRRSFPAELHFTVVDEVLWFSVGREDALDVLASSLDRVAEQLTEPTRSSIPLALVDVSLDKLFPAEEWQDTTGFDRLPLAMLEKLDSLIPRRGGPRDGDGWTFTGVSQVDLSADGVQPTRVHINQNSNARIVTLHKATPQWKEIDLPEPTPTYVSPARVVQSLKVLVQATETNPMQMQKLLQPDQSRIRLQFDAEEKRVRAQVTVGLGVIKHVYSRLLESRSATTPLIFWTDDGSSNRLSVDVEFAYPLDRVESSIEAGK